MKYLYLNLFIQLICISSYSQNRYQNVIDYLAGTERTKQFISKESKFVLKSSPEAVFDQVGFTWFKLWIVKDKNRWGIADSNGKMIVPAKYDTIYPLYTLSDIPSLKDSYASHKKYCSSCKDSATYAKDYSYTLAEKIYALDDLKSILVMECRKNYFYEKYELFNVELNRHCVDKFYELTLKSDEIRRDKKWLFVTKKDDKGILNGDFTYAVPPLYYEVRFFGGRSESPKAYFNDGIYFSIKKLGLYGIYKVGHGELVKTMYDGFYTWSNSKGYYMFRDGITYSVKGTKMGIIDSTGTEVLPAEYDDIEKGTTPGSLLRVGKNKKYGFYSLQEKKLVIPMKYSSGYNNSFFYGRFANNYCVVNDTSGLYVIDTHGNIITGPVVEEDMVVDESGYLYRRKVDTDLWTVIYLPTQKVIHTAATECPELGQFKLPAFENKATILIDEKGMKLVTTEGKILHKFKSVACEGPFKVNDYPIFKDRETLFELTDKNEVKKLKLVTIFDIDQLEYGVLAFYNGKPCTIKTDHDRGGMRLQFLPETINWAKNQETITYMKDYNQAVIEKDKKFGVYDLQRDSIIVEPILSGKKQFNLVEGEPAYRNGKAVFVWGEGNFSVFELADNVKWAIDQRGVKLTDKTWILIEKDNKLGVYDKAMRQILVEPVYSNFTELESYLKTL